jgi:hypothetical protein
MSQIDLHSFRSDLLKKPPIGANGPPIGIRAKDLDENFRKVTLIEGQGNPPEYRLKYTKDGIILTDLLPTLPASGLYVLTASDGALSWTATEGCG